MFLKTLLKLVSTMSHLSHMPVAVALPEDTQNRLQAQNFVCVATLRVIVPWMHTKSTALKLLTMVVLMSVVGEAMTVPMAGES